MDSSADPHRRHTRERILLWWPPASGQVLGTATTTWSLFLTTSWGQPTSTAGSFCVYGVTSLKQPPTRCWWSGCAGGSDMVMQHRGCSWSIPRAATMLPSPHPRPSVCRHPCHECSHEDARLPHLAVAWQVVGSLQRLLHESIPSMNSL